ncbi:MAG: caspase family protein, partial [Planctomycetota bacterium]|nr:caspase family protein [Planctomycetota bacterium]
MNKHTRCLSALLFLPIFLLAAPGCMSIDRPKPLKEDLEFLKKFQSVQLSSKVVMTSVVSKVKTKENAFLEGQSLVYRPPIAEGDLDKLSSDFRTVIQRLFKSPLDIINAKSGSSDAQRQLIFQTAESKGAELVLEVNLTQNQLSYVGSNSIAWLCDLLLGISAPPWHWWIPDESFELVRRVEVNLYDVRDRKKPIYQTTVSGVEKQTLNEFQHSIVLFNPMLALWTEASERYGPENWQTVYQGFEPHAQQSLCRNLIESLSVTLKAQLESPILKERLERGDPAEARLYAVVVGQDFGSAKSASADANAFTKLLHERFGLPKIHMILFEKKESPALLLKRIGQLRTKAVDRVLFYFSGQGHQSNRGQSLLFSNGEKLSLSRLSGAFKKLRSENVAFLLDTSFGDSMRGKKKGSRTAQGSLNSLPPEAEARYLAPLYNSSRGWQVLCPAAHDEMTGEFRSQGHFTGL